MAGVKTAVSLRESLFQQVEALAREMKAPRSRPFATALEDFRRRPQDRQLLRRINFDSSRICTVVVCAHAFSLRRASAPRNMLLEKDEAALPEQNVVNVSRVLTVDRGYLIVSGEPPGFKYNLVRSGQNHSIEGGQAKNA